MRRRPFKPTIYYYYYYYLKGKKKGEEKKEETKKKGKKINFSIEIFVLRCCLILKFIGLR